MTATFTTPPYADGDVPLADLAEEYSVVRSTIHRIIHTSATDAAAIEPPAPPATTG